MEKRQSLSQRLGNRIMCGMAVLFLITAAIFGWTVFESAKVPTWITAFLGVVYALLGVGALTMPKQ